MKIENLNEFFKDLDLDFAEPSAGHNERFLERLQKKQEKQKPKSKLRNLWIPFSAIAACALIAFLMFGNIISQNISANSGDLANVSPEMKETQKFYTTLINSELEKVDAAKSPETIAIINDAKLQLEKLDVEYEKLKKDLVKSGNDKRVIFAMVSNLQQRIDLLNNVIQSIDTINSLKTTQNENNFI
ncbi:DUF4179 domain-containing protein [Gillisia sp. M10.2A]|uniref:DUF4179 domain-containing protein n=1 Tax=Gillisia lutea TaxID=2909668 RepID=A0ABS9EIX7_9FLAO|nr:DUF4179 domain-containing protein [Gillisia lutea]MCF4102815.1 DUF4179 domain-containing protein [Gillisia lutea]